MLRNNLKLSFRHLLKERMVTIINFFGLSVGIAVCVLILLHVIAQLTVFWNVRNATSKNPAEILHYE